MPQHFSEFAHRYQLHPVWSGSQGLSVCGLSATPPARSAPCLTPGCFSLPVRHCWSWCGCSELLRRNLGIQEFSDGTGRSRQRSAPPAPGLSRWPLSWWADGPRPLTERRQKSGWGHQVNKVNKVNKVTVDNYTELTCHRWGLSNCTWKNRDVLIVS